ncbi:MAG: protein kinase [Gemmatimonadales bacterium]
MTDSLLAQLRAALGATYLLERELGGGGMSRVFLAEEPDLGRKVVIKVLPRDFGGGLITERFRREILLAARLQHPNIVPLITAGDVGGQPFFVMPYVAGDSLRSRLDTEKALPVSEVLAILRDVARALAFAHEHGVIHRDIKPGNILLAGGAAVVTDFGVAKALSGEATPADAADALTLVGTSLGTPAYMAPEQAAADPATDHRADLYAFGVVAYEMLAGRTPFAGRSGQALLAAHLTERPPPITEVRPDTPPALAAVVMACLEKDPGHRPATASEIVVALENLSGATVATIRGRAGPRSRTLAITLGVVAVLVAAAWAWRHRGAPAADGFARTSLAVLPLAAAGGTEDEYFADGLTDELTTALSRVPGIRVASRTASFAYKGRDDVDLQDVGRKLRVGSVLEGTVRREGDRLRVNARLSSTEDGFTLWSQSYQRSTSDLFAVQDELAGAVAGALQGTLAAGRAPVTVRRGTADLAAYDLYLRGRFFWRRRGTGALREAAGYFSRAIERDSSFPQAWAGLADALSLLPVYGPTPLDSVMRPARAAARRALNLDSTLAEAHATLGQLLKSNGDWAASERNLRQATVLDPSYPPAQQWLGEVLYLTGRPGEALDAMRAAAALDPASPIIAMELSYVLALAGEPDRAMEQGRRAVALDPESWPVHAFVGAAALVAGRPADAVRELEDARRLNPDLPPPFQGVLANAYANAGRVDSARAMLARLGAADTPSASALAIIYSGLGRVDSALVWLDRAVDRRDPFLYASSLTPGWYDPLRGEPGFASLAVRMGLDTALVTR